MESCSDHPATHCGHIQKGFPWLGFCLRWTGPLWKMRWPLSNNHIFCMFNFPLAVTEDHQHLSTVCAIGGPGRCSDVPVQSQNHVIFVLVSTGLDQTGSQVTLACVRLVIQNCVLALQKRQDWKTSRVRPISLFETQTCDYFQNF